jgi:stage II sporulation protein D
MTTRINKRILFVTIAIIYLTTLLLPIHSISSYAASIPTLDQIRVTLFIDSRGTVPAVTLSSSEALVVGERKVDGIKDWLTSPAGQPMRFSMNAYSLKVIETVDYAIAMQAYQQIATLGQAELFAVPGKGQAKYQVRLGGYRTAEEASSAKSLIPAAIQSGNAAPEVAGPYYASAGSFATQDEAINRQAALAQAGVTAYISIHPNESGAIVYSMWLGEASSEAALEQSKSAAAAAVSGLTLQNIKMDVPYLIIRSDVSASASAAGIVHYRFNPQNQNLRVRTAEAPIQVAERYGRTYRGQMEITSYNGRLALINELPFEQYLYSVVGSELGASWPLEALKAQAVAARTYALKQGLKYKIAHISDTTFDQAYKGKGAEFIQAIESVDATRSEVIVNNEGLILPYYSSNAGGATATISEAWTTPVSYIKSVTSPDEVAQAGKPIWYRIMLPDGTSAYVSSDYAKISADKNEAGLPYIEIQGEGINIRRAPFVDNTMNAAVRQASTGERFVQIGQEIESNAFNWIRGPFSAAELTATINARSANAVVGSLQSLEVTARGESNRVTGVTANGTVLELSNADTFRSALGGLPSTLFEIEETGKYTVLGAGGRTQTYTSTSSAVTVQSVAGTQALSSQEFYVLNGLGDIRAATTAPAYRFIGKGFGHGVGLSQYGAKAFAEQGYDYQKILKHYYDGVQIVKE